MTLKDFLAKAHDLSVDEYHLKEAFKNLIRPSYSETRNLDKSEQDLVFSLVLELRKKVLREHIRYSSSELQAKYLKIWEKRLALGLQENDLKDIKEVIFSFGNK